MAHIKHSLVKLFKDEFRSLILYYQVKLDYVLESAKDKVYRN